MKCRRGFSLVQILIALVAISGLALLVTQLGKIANESSQKVKAVDAFSSLRAQTSLIRSDAQTWVSALRAPPVNPGPITGWSPNGCLPMSPTATVFTCPARVPTTQFADNELKSIKFSDGATGFIASVELANAQGALIAGTVGAPIYYDSNGVVCTGATTCPYKMTGYLMTKANGASNPGDVQFVFKIEQNLTVPGTTKMKSSIEIVEVPQAVWTIPPDPKCSAGYFVGLDSGGNKACFQVKQCPTGQAISGWALAATPVTPPTWNAACVNVAPPVSSSCTSPQVAVGINSDGTLKCQ